MPALPTGTVTFLFTDIEGSTALLQRLAFSPASDLASCVTGAVRLPRLGGESILRVSTCSHHLPYSLCSSLYRAPRASADVGGFGCLPVSWNCFVGHSSPRLH